MSSKRRSRIATYIMDYKSQNSLASGLKLDEKLVLAMKLFALAVLEALVHGWGRPTII